jgi:hypothetical protein
MTCYASWIATKYKRQRQGVGSARLLLEKRKEREERKTILLYASVTTPPTFTSTIYHAAMSLSSPSASPNRLAFFTSNPCPSSTS